MPSETMSRVLASLQRSYWFSCTCFRRKRNCIVRRARVDFRVDILHLHGSAAFAEETDPRFDKYVSTALYGAAMDKCQCIFGS
jgi:hypothetical protein